MGLSSTATPAQFPFPTELLRGEGNLFINRDITQGQSGVRKIKRRLPFLEIVDCHLLGNCYSNYTKNTMNTRSGAPWSCSTHILYKANGSQLSGVLEAECSKAQMDPGAGEGRGGVVSSGRGSRGK